MALIGISFGLGFIFGPVIGGVALQYLGVLAPGLIAGALCGVNLLMAWVRLPETLDPGIQAANRALHWRHYDPLNTASLRKALRHPYLWLLLAISFLQLTAFSNMEQVFALFFKAHLSFSIEDAGLKTGYALAFVGLVAALMQGFTRRIAPRFGERRMLVLGLFLFAVMLFVMPYGPTYASYFLILAPLAIGRSLIDPSMSSLISLASSAQEQGRTFGTFQGLNSLARVVGPAVGIWLFEKDIKLPFFLGGAMSVVVFAMSVYLLMKTKNLQGVDALQPKV
jgi:MFS transporter, DHA1 family, tetracycline resistance protein